MSPRFSIRPPASLADRRLAELAARGDERAFETLIRRHRRELERHCRRLGLADDRAEDVLQQSFTRAWLALRDGSAVGQPRPWLFRIVHNAALNAHRSARLRDHEPLDTVTSGTLAGRAAENVESGVLARDALRLLAELPRMQRDAVVMTAIEGRSHEEAAGMLGVSDGAVRGLVHRARTRLRAAAAVMSPQGIAALLSRAPADGTAEAGAGLGAMLAKGAAVAAVSGLAAGGAAIHLEHRRAVRTEASPHASVLAAVKAPASVARHRLLPARVVVPVRIEGRARPHRAQRLRMRPSGRLRGRRRTEDASRRLSGSVREQVRLGEGSDRRRSRGVPAVRGPAFDEAPRESSEGQRRQREISSAGPPDEAAEAGVPPDGSRDGGVGRPSWSDRGDLGADAEAQPSGEPATQPEREPG